MGSVTLRLTTQDRERWTAAANLEGRSLSNWIRWVCDGAVAGTQEPGRELTRQIAKAKDGGLTDQDLRDAEEKQERQKFLDTAVEASKLPRARPVKRKHLPEIQDAERTPGGRCTYMPLGDKKCPRCGKVHSRV